MKQQLKKQTECTEAKAAAEKARQNVQAKAAAEVYETQAKEDKTKAEKAKTQAEEARQNVKKFKAAITNNGEAGLVEALAYLKDTPMSLTAEHFAGVTASLLTQPVEVSPETKIGSDLLTADSTGSSESSDLTSVLDFIARRGLDDENGFHMTQITILKAIKALIGEKNRTAAQIQSTQRSISSNVKIIANQLDVLLAHHDRLNQQDKERIKEVAKRNIVGYELVDPFANEAISAPFDEAVEGYVLALCKNLAAHAVAVIALNTKISRFFRSSVQRTALDVPESAIDLLKTPYLKFQTRIYLKS